LHDDASRPAPLDVGFIADAVDAYPLPHRIAPRICTNELPQVPWRSENSHRFLASNPRGFSSDLSGI
jgi:hypothetical protein